MLSIKPLTGGGGDIYAYLSQGDYYSERDRVSGRWYGEGAAALGLTGDVRLEDFENIREGNDPKTGKFIRVRKGKNYMYDCTLSAPKSVSILVRPGGDRRLDRAHEIAVNEALAQMERETVCKVQKGCKYSERKTGSLIAAVYTHDTSRELDPQLHSHCVLANMTFDAKEGRWKALHASAIFARKAFLQEVYRNVLAREVMKLGYRIEDTWNDRHTDRSFEIVGIDKSLRRKFSKMSGRIAKAIDQFIVKYRTRPSDREVGQLARSNEVRPDKMYKISGEEVAARQLAQLTEAEKAQIIATREKAGANDGREPEPWDVGVSVQFALDHLFQRVSVAKNYEIARLALIHGRGKISVEAIENHLAELKQTGCNLAPQGRHRNPAKR
jgi:conjugative relaxase-like TrwC/TraI family protein